LKLGSSSIGEGNQSNHLQSINPPPLDPTFWKKINCLKRIITFFIIIIMVTTNPTYYASITTQQALYHSCVAWGSPL
jgi:hypothetical protein